MSAQVSLYRKWRPQTFGDLKGQDVIRDTIFYAVTHGHMSQAYLFCGPRGTGKTTTARLIAKLVNCIAEGNEKPCNSCASCTTITDGANFDIIEVDAASNRGIDEIRQLRDSVRFAPTQAKYKVFIIDEVHMLTREAFNALLKTLEEPPAYALFILATTESHKIPATIISRCQRYDFRLASQDTLTHHLLYVAKEEGINLTPDGAAFVARLGEGSFRDALSLLDQIKTSQREVYTLEVIEELFGYIPRDHLAQCLVTVMRGNVGEAHAAIDSALARGVDVRAFCDQLVAMSQSMLEGLALGDLSALPDSLASAVKSAGMKRVVQWIELLLEAMSQMKQSPIPRLPLDIAVTKFATSSSGLGNGESTSGAVSVTPVAQKVRVMPKQEVPVMAQVVTVESVPTVAVQETVSVPVLVELPETIEPQDWQGVLQGLKEEAPSLVTSLVHGRVLGLDGDVLKVAVRFKMHADKVNQPKNRQVIERILATVVQAPLKIEAHVVKDLPIEENTVDVADVFEFEE